MVRNYDISRYQKDGATVVTVGTFDGVHAGHRAILQFLIQEARKANASSALVTFDPHPREVVYESEVALLTTVEERAELCRELGVERFVVVPFTREFSELTPEQFVTEILIDRIGMKEIIIGHDHGFGRGRSGDEQFLTQLGKRVGFTVRAIPAEVLNDHPVSSSTIRRMISEEGNVSGARILLGAPYRLTGMVVRGRQRGRTIGFPTANLEPVHERKIIPATGVYAVRVYIEGSTDIFDGMMNIGRRPTFEDTGLHLEVHLIAFEEDLYEQQLRVEFIDRIRPERKFESIEALVAQLNDDRARCTAVIKSAP